jgi:hypothetical protein
MDSANLHRFHWERSGYLKDGIVKFTIVRPLG